MPGSDLASFNPMLKDQALLDGVKKQINEKTVLLSWLEKTSDYIDATGRKAIFPALISWPQGNGARPELGNLPKPKPSKTAQGEVNLSYQYMRLMFSGPALEKAKTNKGAFVDLMTFEMDQAIPSVRRDINRQMLTGIGAGNITRVGNTQSGVTISVDGTVNLYENMAIDIYAKSTASDFSDATLIAHDLTIVSVDDQALQITLSAALPSTSASPSIWYIFRSESIGSECMGLPGIVDDGTLIDNFEGISRATYPRWKGLVFNNNKTLTAITEQVIQPAYSGIEKTGIPVKMAISSFELRDGLASTLLSLKRFNDQGAYKLRAGFKGLEFNDLLVFADEQLSYNASLSNPFYLLCPSTFAVHQTGEMKWDELGGPILTKVSGVHAYEALMYWFMQLACYRPNANAVTTYLRKS